MSELILVCPYHKPLIDKLRQRAIVIRTNDCNLIRPILHTVNKSNKLHAIKIETDTPASKIPFDDDWKRIPIALYTSRLGSFKAFVHKLALLRQLNIKIFLSSGEEENYLNLCILSSLRIACGVYFSEPPVNWERMNDLMHYAVYSRTIHAPIEPFYYVVSNFEGEKQVDYASVYFDNPLRYIHINEKEQIAATSKDLEACSYLAEGVSSIDSLETSTQYRKYINNWQDFFIERRACSFCPAWRICMGKFREEAEQNEGCRVFFRDLMDAADYYRLQFSQDGKKVWQS